MRVGVFAYMRVSRQPHREERGSNTTRTQPTRAHRSAFEGIAGLLRSRFPGCGVSVFGSAANALGVRDNNDIDVSLSLEGLEDSREAKGGCRDAQRPRSRAVPACAR